MCFRFKKLLILLTLISHFPLFSLYNGNPSMPEMPEEGYFISKESWLTIKAGYEGDIVFSREMELTHHHSNVKEHVKSFESWMNSGTLTLGFTDRVELYTALGTTSAKIKQHPHSDQSVEYRTRNHFAWLAGMRAIAAYWGDLQLGLDAKYLQTLPDMHEIKLNGTRVPVSGAHVDYREWQVGLGLSYKWRFFIPYFGVKYSDVRAKFKHLHSLSTIFPKKHFTMKNEDPIGLFVGFGLSAERIFALNLEFRFLDETAGTVSADIRF